MFDVEQTLLGPQRADPQCTPRNVLGVKPVKSNYTVLILMSEAGAILSLFLCNVFMKSLKGGYRFPLKKPTPPVKNVTLFTL